VLMVCLNIYVGAFIASILMLLCTKLVHAFFDLLNKSVTALPKHY